MHGLRAQSTAGHCGRGCWGGGSGGSVGCSDCAPDVQEELLCLLGLSHAACGQGADAGPC